MKLSLATTNGTFYVVATPIGHLGDMTPRAVETLQSVSLILAENPHHSRALLQAFGIKTPVVACHMHNEKDKVDAVVGQLKEGHSIALVSDAGTPLVSDPGFLLVRALKQHGISVVPIPGACSLIAALSASGVPTTRFMFDGFLPVKSTARQKRLVTLKMFEMTVICFEAPHRMLSCLSDIATVFGLDYEMVIAKEISKTFETIKLGAVSTLQAWLQADDKRQKGEFVLLLPFLEAEKTEVASDKVLKILLSELPLKQAVHLAERLTNENKNELYHRALYLKNNV